MCMPAPQTVCPAPTHSGVGERDALIPAHRHTVPPGRQQREVGRHRVGWGQDGVLRYPGRVAVMPHLDDVGGHLLGKCEGEMEEMKTSGNSALLNG